MKEKKGFGDQLEAFFEGKGFYIVLFLCAAVIGVSAWTLVAGTDVETRINDIEAAGIVVTPGAAASAAPIPSATPRPEPVQTPAPETTPVDAAEGGSAEVWNEEPASDLFVWPVNGEIVTPYSVNSLVYDATMEDWRAHSGIDISAPIGTYVLAVSAGEVKSVESDPMYGTTVVIEHSGGVESVYSGLASQPTVYPGDSVSAGTVIGAVGDTAVCESALGAHLLFAMTENGENTDPAGYLP